MALFGGNKDDKPAPSGMEMMLRSMGMGPILDMGLQLANDGTLGKIVAFAENAEEILNTLRKVENELRLAREIRNGTPGGGTAVVGVEPGAVVPGAIGNDGEPPRQLVAGLSDGGGTVRHVNGSGSAANEFARPATDNGASGDA